MPMTHTFCETLHSEHHEMNNYLAGSLHVLCKLTWESLVRSATFLVVASLEAAAKTARCAVLGQAEKVKKNN